MHPIILTVIEAFDSMPIKLYFSAIKECDTYAEAIHFYPYEGHVLAESLLDLVISESKYLSHAGTVEDFVSDHQAVYIVKIQPREKREMMQFVGRSYRLFNAEMFWERLENKTLTSFDDMIYHRGNVLN